MTESEYKAEIKALKEAQKSDQKKIAKLEAQNESLKSKRKADKAAIKNLKRRKDPKKAKAAELHTQINSQLSPKKKEQMLRSMKPLGLSAQQKEKIEELFPGITSMSSLFD